MNSKIYNEIGNIPILRDQFEVVFKEIDLLLKEINELKSDIAYVAGKREGRREMIERLRGY